MWACCKNFGELRKFSEPIHLSDVYLPVHATGRGKESEKQSITGYEIMSSIRPSYLRSTLTERFNGYEGCIVLQNANAQPLHPHRR
jgi:predicted transcriptional regulator